MTAQLLSGLIIGVGVAVIGSIVSHLLIMRREVKRWEHEDRRQRDAWERETQLRHRDDRVALYKTFLANERTMTDSWTAATKEGTEALVRLRQDLAEIELLASKKVSSPAEELFTYAVYVSDLEMKRQDAEAEEDHEAAERHSVDIERVKPTQRKRRQAFVRAAREELGVDVVRVLEEAEK